MSDVKLTREVEPDGVLRIGRDEYRDKVYACWLGKNIGGTLGAPWEGKKHVHALTFYDPVPDKSAPNDDLDLQLVWLQMLEEKGVDPSVAHFAEYWSRYASAYPWNEYGFFMRNARRGLRPPVAGCFENYFVDEMGSPIRSEIWACLHPGDPQSAARMAWKDSALDHAGGEGTWGEMFWAAVEAAAFVEDDPLVLINIGLSMIPLSSHVARAIRDAVWCFQNGLNWGQARERIVVWFGHYHACNAVPNHGFTILGWLYGLDFGDRLCKAVNCGYDTDCTGATLGSVLGILGGTKAIPETWIAPIGREIVLHKFTRGLNAPKDLGELTDRTVALAETSVGASASVSFDKRTELPANLLSRLFRNDLARQAAAQDNHCGIECVDGRDVALHYGGEPVLRPGIAKVVSVSVDGRHDLDARLAGPADWHVRRLGPSRFELWAEAVIDPRNKLTVEVDGLTVEFTILGPDEARGYAAGDNVPRCAKCGALREGCFCDD